MAVQIIGFTNEANKPIGLKAGDIISTVNGKQIEGSVELKSAMTENDNTVEFYRDTKQLVAWLSGIELQSLALEKAQAPEAISPRKISTRSQPTPKSPAPNKKAVDDRIDCPGCSRRIVPRVVYWQGHPVKTVCPFCTVTVANFDQSESRKTVFIMFIFFGLIMLLMSALR
ncbi:MAG: hypothetical protein M1473_04875 [Firmicutes bacterium]|nr:hypothetical protein [Gammaproteobacteria bacterium]MCL5049850.1 hypothetical protein [Bacillota bacterium]